MRVGDKQMDHVQNIQGEFLNRRLIGKLFYLTIKFHNNHT